MGEAPEVSVVVPTRNRRALLAETVASVLLQKGTTWELIIVDDASEDDTAEWLDTVTDARVRRVRLPRHAERSAARNAGLELARAPLIMFLDDDDLLEPGALATLAAALRSHPGAVAAVGARRDWFPAVGSKWRDVHPRWLQTRDVFEPLLFGWSTAPGQVLHRTDLIRRIGGWADDLAPVEDRDLWLRVARHGPVCLCPQVVLTYRAREKTPLPDIRQRREIVARRAIRRLPRHRRRSALRIRRGTALVDQAHDEMGRGHFVRGTVLAVRATALAPGVLLSPLVGLWIARLLGYAGFRRVWPRRGRA